jgi:alginate O-acetyltransferase complex protein AlgI
MGEYIREQWMQLFLYREDAPMIFTNFYFWGFFTIVYFVFSILHKRITVRNLFLFLVSIFFYYKTSGFYFTLLLFTICSDFLIGHRLFLTNNVLKRRLLLSLSVSINLLILGYFKYAYFFTESYNSIFQTNYEVLNYFAVFKNSITGSGTLIDRIILPVGISFYTFQAISYTSDIYFRKIQPLKNLLDFGFYVSFFPQLVAGPIVRAKEFIPQIHKPFFLTGVKFGLAVFMILNGLIKKMVFGDYMAVQFIDKVYANPIIFTGFENLMAMFCYSLQVYLDFSGYTDIAIGVALLMGFRFNINFNSPYKAVSVEEFWKRWHISFSTWLRDYLYIPLGGNRGGSIASYILITVILIVLVLIIGEYSLFWKFAMGAYGLVVLSWIFPAFKKAMDHNINLMITMLLGGLWHGSSWNFVTWGGLNGLGLVFYKYWKRISPYEKWKVWYIRAFRIGLTFVFISFTRIWFRAPDKETADTVLNKILFDTDWRLAPAVIENFAVVFSLLLGGMIIHWLPTSFKRGYRNWFIRTHPWVKVGAVVATIVLIWQSITADMVPFIYFQF